MPIATVLRCTAFGVALAALGGCAAISTVTSARERLDGYELRPLPGSGAAAAGGRHIEVETPIASGSLTTDRIMIKPSPLQVEYLAGGRWVDEAPRHVQLILARSLTNTGRFALVSAGSARADADYYLLPDLQALQAELEPDGETVRAVVRLKLALVDDDGREVVAARTFEGRASASEPTAAAVVPALDRAMVQVLQEVIAWTLRLAG